ncbi:DUF167 domain-containing protein [Candidatus Auribacterota bacterium]
MTVKTINMLNIQQSRSGLLIKVKVTPGAKKNEIAGEYDGGLKLKIKSPPVEGKANKACINLLSEILGILKSNIDLVKGQTSTIKTFCVSGMTREDLIKRIQKNM